MNMLTQNSYRGAQLFSPYPNCPYTDPVLIKKKCRLYSNCTGCNLTSPLSIKPYIKLLPGKPTSQFIQLLTSASCSNYVTPTNEGVKYGSYDRVLRRRRSVVKCPTLCTSSKCDLLYI
jgi:hypothetical protein